MKEKDHGNVNDAQSDRLTEEDINSPEFDPEEFAPAPGRSMAPGIPNMKNSLFMVILCAACAFILAITNVFTVFAADKGEKDMRREAVLRLFSDCDRAELYDTVKDCPVYVVYYKGKLAGYAVYVTENGYIGTIEMLVAMDSDNKVSQVKIISHSESEGLGSKITKSKFLSQFIGMPEEEASADLISGATVSSRAVQNGVMRVLELELDFLAIAEDLNVDTISAAEIKEDLEKDDEPDGDITTDDTAQPAVTTRPGDDTVFGGDNVGGPNSNMGGGDISAGGVDGTTVYETETEEPEETSAEETTADTTAPADPPAVTAEPQPPVTEAPPSTTAPEEPSEPDDSTAPPETSDPADSETSAPTTDSDSGSGGWPGWG